MCPDRLHKLTESSQLSSTQDVTEVSIHFECLMSINIHIELSPSPFLPLPSPSVPLSPSSPSSPSSSVPLSPSFPPSLSDPVISCVTDSNCALFISTN